MPALTSAILLCVPVVAVGSFSLVLRAPRIGMLLLLALEILTPPIPLGHTTLNLAKIALLAGLSAIVWSGLSRAQWKYRLMRFPEFASRSFVTLTITLAALIITTALTLLSAQYPGVVLRESAKALEYLGIVFFAAHAGKSDENPATFIRGFAVLIIIVALLACAQEWTGAPSVFRAHGHLIPRIAGPLEGPNQLAAYLGLAVPVLYAYAVEDQTMLLSGALAMGIITEILTFSRGGIITTALALAMLMIRRTRRWRPGDSVVLLASTGGIFCALAVAGSGIGHLATLDNAGPTGGVGHRAELWRAAYLLWQQHPWLGIGAGNFELELSTVGLIGVRTHANSLYLQAFAEGGIILGIITLLSMYIPLRLLAKHIQPTTLSCGVLAAGVGFALHQCVDTLVFYPKIGLLWWMLVGYAIQTKQPHSSTGASPSDSP